MAHGPGSEQAYASRRLGATRRTPAHGWRKLPASVFGWERLGSRSRFKATSRFRCRSAVTLGLSCSPIERPGPGSSPGWQKRPQA